MSEDFLGSLGHLALGSRLKRIGTVLQGETQALFYEDFCDVPAAHMPMLAALDARGPLSVGELAAALGVAQPGVSRVASSLQRGGWIQPVPDQNDKRLKRLRLTAKGQVMIDKAKRELWPLIESAVAALCADLRGPLLAQLAGLEKKLADGDFSDAASQSTANREPSNADA